MPSQNTVAVRRRRLSSIHGFTLIELLACVLIIGLLAALLLPAFSSIQKRGEGVKCMSNLRQLAAGCLAYSGDNNGQLVPMAYSPSSSGSGSDASTWRILIAPYVGEKAKDTKTIFQCPSDRSNFNVALSGNGLAPSSYGINFFTHQPGFLTTQYLHGYLNHPSLHGLSAILHPSQTIFICDLALVSNPSAPVTQWKDKGSTGNYGYARMPADLSGANDSGFYGGSDSWDIFPRHGGTFANVAFYDGHIAAVDVQKQVIDCPPTNPQCIYDNK